MCTRWLFWFKRDTYREGYSMRIWKVWFMFINHALNCGFLRTWRFLFQPSRVPHSRLKWGWQLHTSPWRASVAAAFVCCFLLIWCLGEAAQHCCFSFVLAADVTSAELQPRIMQHKPPSAEKRQIRPRELYWRLSLEKCWFECQLI